MIPLVDRLPEDRSGVSFWRRIGEQSEQNPPQEDGVKGVGTRNRTGRISYHCKLPILIHFYVLLRLQRGWVPSPWSPLQASTLGQLPGFAVQCLLSIPHISPVNYASFFPSGLTNARPILGLRAIFQTLVVRPIYQYPPFRHDLSGKRGDGGQGSGDSSGEGMRRPRGLKLEA